MVDAERDPGAPGVFGLSQNVPPPATANGLGKTGSRQNVSPPRRAMGMPPSREQ